MEDNRVRPIYKRLRRFLKNPRELFLIQSIEEQKILVCVKDAVIERFDASTSRYGIGIRENSFKTPPGLHRISQKIGSGAPTGRIFREREDTNIDWDRFSTEDNLILTRILRLEGMEVGVNKGDGVDSYERCIYIHGTNREDLVGKPLSHGCLCMKSADISHLFDVVREGTLVYIDPPPLEIDGLQCRGFHFTGIFGTGMSALAQFVRFQGIPVSGSDRLLGSEDTASIRRLLEGLGCVIVEQDGSGIGEDIDVVCVSTAIEESNPDMATARARGLPIVHRSDLLASLVASRRTIAVAGTSGKSTVTAMIFELLTACNRSPSLISGAPLIMLEKTGLIGNAYSGASDILIIEADESDGSLVKYAPEISVVLNISKDHKSVDEIKSFFKTLTSRSSWTAVNADDPGVASIPATVSFGSNSSASWHPDREELLRTSVRLFREGVEYHLPFPGRHNLENLRAALCVCEHLGCERKTLARAVKGFGGVARRFTMTITAQGVHVVDDFAHNPAKIKAAVSAARGLSERIIAVYQPHGFGPTRFLRDEYITTIRTLFRRKDSFYLMPIYYAGGTAQQDISSEDIVKGLGSVPFNAQTIKGWEELLARLKVDAKLDDCVLLMGARDPSLPTLAKRIVELFGGAVKKT